MTPGRCKGKAHRPAHLGIAGRRVLVSRKWSNKILDDHRAWRAADPAPELAMTMLKRRRLVTATEVQPVFPDTLGGWRDPSNVRRVWREVRDDAQMDGLVSHTLRKTVASFLDDSDVSARKISDQLGHSKVSMTQDHYLGRKLTDRQTADVLEELMGSDETGARK